MYIFVNQNKNLMLNKRNYYFIYERKIPFVRNKCSFPYFSVESFLEISFAAYIILSIHQMHNFYVNIIKIFIYL